MLSLCENNKDIGAINIYCAAMDVAKENIQMLNATVEKYNRKIIYMNVHNRKIKTAALDYSNKLHPGRALYSAYAHQCQTLEWLSCYMD